MLLDSRLRESMRASLASDYPGLCNTETLGMRMYDKGLWRRSIPRKTADAVLPD